jgi:hypothetical protein
VAAAQNVHEDAAHAERFAAETDQWYRSVIPGCGNLSAPAARTVFTDKQRRFNHELSIRVWREDPAPLTMLLERYAGREDPIRAADRYRVGDMQRDVLAGLPRHVRPAARVVLRLCETHLQSHGVIKRSFLQCFDVARAATRRLGEIHHQAGALDDPEHVFFLTADELLGELPSDVWAVIDKRRSLRECHERFAFAERLGRPSACESGGAGGH